MKSEMRTYINYTIPMLLSLIYSMPGFASDMESNYSEYCNLLGYSKSVETVGNDIILQEYHKEGHLRSDWSINGQQLVSNITNDSTYCNGEKSSKYGKANTIYFAFDSAKLSDQAKKKVDVLLGVIDSNTELKIIGNTDMVGTEKYNYQLGIRRALSIKNYIINSGKIYKGHILVYSKGELEPVSSTSVYNRRAVIRY